MTLPTLVLRYAGFALVAVLVNLAVQRGVLALSHGLLAALIAGTAAGLVVKYLLDKIWIFEDRAAGLAAHGRRFSLYTLMGVATTAIFWGTESAAWAIWQTDAAREAGAVLGLSIGYVVKYRLDRRFVFVSGVAA
ncbi:GtrA family protein [Pseudooceanicola sp.]|uniref:GtrA family protein n=1 Tax=Pseudooceanicola sp. TaxID=1914328 RepID=UPI0035C66C47